MSSKPIRTDALEAVQRSNARWRAGALCMGGLLVGLLLGASGASQPTNGRRGLEVVGVSGGDRYIYRVWSNGRVDRLDASGELRSAEGIAGWSMMKIDEHLKMRDAILLGS